MGGFSCCGPKVEYTGSIFYKVIDTHLEKTGKIELDSVFEKADDPLEQSEKTRKRMAETFKTMTILTGTCVLKVPDLEQCLRAYLIRFLIEVKKTAPTLGGLKQEFDISELYKLFKFEQTQPFISFDEAKLNELLKTHNFNPMEGELGQMKDSIVNFLKSITGIKQIFNEFAKEMGEIRLEAYEFITKLKLSDGASSIYNNLQIGRRNLQKIFDMRIILEIFSEVSKQMKEAVQVFGNVCSDRVKFKQYEDLACQMIEKNISNDMKRLVWESTNEPRLDKFEDWEHNFEYKLNNQVE